jgi:branched-chain amino acid transport system substrate-binding protein
VVKAPLAIGVLADHPAAGGDDFLRIVRSAFAEARDEGRLAHDLEIVAERAEGLPRGTVAAVVAAFERLDARGVVAIIGPAISDNALVIRDLADEASLPCINWTGGEQTRSAWMFHYQVGSLEEEPAVLAAHLAARGARRIAVVGDDSIVGRRCLEFFRDAVPLHGLAIADEIVVGPGDDAAAVLPALLRPLRDQAPDALVYLGMWALARQLAVALAAVGWRPAVVSNSALMFGHVSPEWRRGWDGWRYVDAYSDANPLLRRIVADGGPHAGVPQVTAAAAYDMGRLVAAGVAHAPEPTRAGVKQGLERVKLLPSALGASGTTMSFGPWERAALKGRYLVLREWRGGQSVEVEG